MLLARYVFNFICYAKAHFFLQKLAVDELKELREDGMEVAMAGDGKYDSPGTGGSSLIAFDFNQLLIFRLGSKVLYLYCTVLADQEDSWLVGCREIHGKGHKEFTNAKKTQLFFNTKFYKS